MIIITKEITDTKIATEIKETQINLKNKKDEVKTYLGQAYRIDQRINSKLEQLEALNVLATKATSTLRDMPTSSSRNVHKMEDTIVKIVDMEGEINKTIDDLVDLKLKITTEIFTMESSEHKTLLELRYLCFKTWEQIANEMGYSVRGIYKLHNKALESFIF